MSATAEQRALERARFNAKFSRPLAVATTSARLAPAQASARLAPATTSARLAAATVAASADGSAPGFVEAVAARLGVSTTATFDEFMEAADRKIAEADSSRRQTAEQLADEAFDRALFGGAA